MSTDAEALRKDLEEELEPYVPSPGEDWFVTGGLEEDLKRAFNRHQVWDFTLDLNGEGRISISINGQSGYFPVDSEGNVDDFVAL